MNLLRESVLALLVTGLAAFASEPPASFEQARVMAAEQGRPILIEFVRADCEYCEQAARDAESDPAVRQALDEVAHVVLDARAGQGAELATEYHAGPYFPLFVLTDSTGAVINRWTGWVGARQFLAKFRAAMNDLTTIDQHAAAFERSPTVAEGTLLAEYYKEAGQFQSSAYYYRRVAAADSSDRDYSYEIFNAEASACWIDQMAFDEVLPAADAVLTAGDPERVARTARLLARLARRKGTTDRIGEYLEAGRQASQGSRDEQMRRWHEDLRSDCALYIDHDTAAAIAIEEESLGAGWEKELDQYYPFAEWCLERGINLEQAQSLMTIASQLASDGPFKARHLHLLAKICHARGLPAEAVRYAEEAALQDPDEETYIADRERFRSESSE